MGANAQTSVPVFTAGQVLTAAQQTEINTGIPVFATTVTRDAAFGGAGEKTLAEGQFAYIEATNTTQYYDGAAWQSVGASSGLTLVSTTTIGTTVASVTVSSAFSATYDNYLILISNSVSSATGYVGLKFGAAATNYYGTSVSVNLGGTVSGAADNNAAALLKALQSATTSFNAVINVNSPFLAAQTYVSANSFTDNSNYYSGKLADSSSYTAFTLTPASGTLTGGTIKVFGYSNS